MAPSSRIRSRTLAAALVLAVLAVAACAMPGDGADRPDADLDPGVPGNVHEVRTLGSWRDGQRAGVYRVVTLRGGVDRVQTGLVVQWMAQGIGEEAPQVVAARRVEVLDDLGPIVVEEVREAAVPEGLRLTVRYRHLVSGAKGDVEVLAGAPGELTAL